MTLNRELLLNNLVGAQERIEQARHRGGRGQRVRMLAATKYLPVEDMALLHEAGVTLVGENRTDQLVAKCREYGDELEFHFIGHLQHRKARLVVPCVTLVHSVESIRLVAELDQRAEERVKVLLEVNVSGEESKYGILPRDAEAFLRDASAYPRVDFAGFMTMAPLVDRPEEVRPVFKHLRELRDELAPVFSSRYDLSELSMGMSNDFEVAVEEGATIVRLGSTLFREGG